MKFWQTFKLLDLWLYMIPCAFLLAGNVNVASAKVPPRCRQIENLTTYKSVAIDNGITGYNIVLANNSEIGFALERTGDVYNHGWPSINLGDNIYGDIKVYLIPNNLDIDKLTCMYPKIKPIGDPDDLYIEDWCADFDGAKYNIGTIPSKYFQVYIDFMKNSHRTDIVCTTCTNITECTIYHYQIKKNLFGKYVLDLVGKDKSCYNICHERSLSKTEIIENATVSLTSRYGILGNIVGILIFLFFGIKHLYKNDKLKNKKLRLILGTFGIVVVNIIYTVGCNAYFPIRNLYIYTIIFIISTLINTLIFKHVLSTKRKYAIIFGFLYYIVGISFLFLPLLQ